MTFITSLSISQLISIILISCFSNNNGNAFSNAFHSIATVTSTRRALSTASQFVPFIRHYPPNHYRNNHHTQLNISTNSDRNDTNNEDEVKKYEYYRPQSRKVLGGDVAYTEQNIRQYATTFQNIRKIGGVECTNDIYIRSKSKGTSSSSSTSSYNYYYWYVGKIARTTGTVSLNQAICKVWNLIEEHACRLRPVELGREFGNLEIWCSKVGDTELQMSQATPIGTSSTSDEDKFALVKMEKYAMEGDKKHVKVSPAEVGFMAEFVTNMGQGFYIIRDDQGKLMR